MSGVDPALLPLLRCPRTGAPLHLARPDEVERALTRARKGELADISGPVAPDFDALLLVPDQRLAYPVRAGVPFLDPRDGFTP